MANNEALEKRLRAVYDAFDQRNHKGAIKLCNAGLQKYPDCQTFKSLKAVALERSGKRDEALQVAEEVLAAAPPDDHVLNMLLLVLKPAQRAADLTAAYEAACSKQPNNQDLLEGLFACHVRSFSYTAQQQVAMKLNKAHPNELYQWWVVASLALQAHAAAVAARLAPAPADSTPSSSSQPATAAAGAGLGADKLLALAEAMAGRLLAKPPAQGGQHSWESVMTYLGLLQAQGKYDAALAAIQGPLGASFSLTAERREAEAAILLAKGDLQAAAELYKQALQEQPDDWAVLLLYLDCLLPATASALPASASTGVAQMVTRIEASTQPGCQAGGLAALMAAMQVGEDGQPPVADRVSQAAAFISSLTVPANNSNSNSSSSASTRGGSASGSASSSVLRGPALAHVELAKRKVQLGVGTEQQLVEALLQYHDRFGHVVSCAMDVFCYLELLGSASRQQLSSALAERAEQAAADFKQQQQEAGEQQSSNKALLKLLRRQMSARQIQADIGAPAFSAPAAAAQHAQQLMQLYATALPLYQGLDERERGPADELLWQAAAALVAAATMEASSSSSSSSGGCIKHLLQAVLVLEAAAKGRPYCAPVRLGLTGLYGLLGDAAGAVQHFSVLDVKHVQHDTLSSHHLLPLLLGLKAPGHTEALLKPMCALFEDHLVDAGDTLMQAYRNGTHTKVLEFVCFKERLERSHTFVLARAERAIHSICTAAAAAAADSAGVSAAVAAAVRAVPLRHLDSLDWRGMRFNDDLTTRLPWLPPNPGPRQLVVLSWWEQQQQQTLQTGSSSGSDAACWWRQVAAIEADLPAAAALRDGMKAAAQQRWLLPHLLHAALDAATSSSSSSSSANDQAPANLPQLLSRLANTHGYSSAAELEQAVQQAFAAAADSSSGNGSGVLLSRQLQLLDTALFCLAHGLQELVAAQQPEAVNGHAAGDTAAGPDPTAVSKATATLAAGLAQLQQHFKLQLQPSAVHKGCVLPGHVLSAAALLLSEGCCWVCVCLETWSKAFRASKKKKGGKAAPAEQQQQHPQLEQTAQSLSQLQQSLGALLAELADGAHQLLQQPEDAAVAAVLAEFDESSDAALRVLVGWEQRVSVQLVLTQLVKQQRALLTQVEESSSRLNKRLHGVSW